MGVVEEVLGAMAAAHVSPDVVSFNTILQVLLRFS
jgi:hypothetical protein